MLDEGFPTQTYAGLQGHYLTGVTNFSDASGNFNHGAGQDLNLRLVVHRFACGDDKLLVLSTDDGNTCQ